MKKNYFLSLIVCASVTMFQVPAYSQQAQGGFFNNLFAPRPAQPANPELGNMMQEWEKETNPVKKKNLARQIQTMVGVKADGVIGRQTMQAIQQAGGMAYLLKQISNLRLQLILTNLLKAVFLVTFSPHDLPSLLIQR